MSIVLLINILETPIRFVAENFLHERSIAERTAHCPSYFRSVRPDVSPATDAEREFPLAFAFTVHEQIGITEMFLKLMYRPVDSYCFHVDKKARTETIYPT